MSSLISKLGRSRLACRLVSCVSSGVSFLSRVRLVVMRFRLVLVRFLSHLLIRPCRVSFFRRLVIMRLSLEFYSDKAAGA